MGAQLAGAALGIWLMAAPQVLEYHGPARMNDHIVGPLVATFACVAIWQATRAVRWVNVLLGGWLVLTPWLFDYPRIAAINSAAVGLLTLTFALVRGNMRHQLGGGWPVLWRRDGAPESSQREAS
jgi:hypothetical protein